MGSATCSGFRHESRGSCSPPGRGCHHRWPAILLHTAHRIKDSSCHTVSPCQLYSFVSILQEIVVGICGGFHHQRGPQDHYVALADESRVHVAILGVGVTVDGGMLRWGTLSDANPAAWFPEHTINKVSHPSSPKSHSLAPRLVASGVILILTISWMSRIERLRYSSAADLS
jgi:hypothetical protein